MRDLVVAVVFSVLVGVLYVVELTPRWTLCLPWLATIVAMTRRS